MEIEPVLPPPLEVLQFTVAHQKVDLEIDFGRRIQGRTELTIYPETKDLKIIKLHSRQCRVEGITINGIKAKSIEHTDPCETLCLHTESSVHQHHLLANKIESSVSSRPTEELQIELPPRLRIESITQKVVTGGVKILNVDGEDAEVAQTLSDVSTPKFTPLIVVISFSSVHLRDALQFVSGHPGSGRWPHVYTRGGFGSGQASCLFPCVDLLNMRCTWDISIKSARTVGDAIRQSIKKTNSEKSTIAELAYEGKEMVFVCTGELTDDIIDKSDSTKRIVSFSTTNNLSAQQIGFAVGPFEKVNLSELRNAQEIEELGGNAVEMIGYCLPGRINEVNNTCLPTTRAMDWFIRKYLACPYSSFSMCFVEDISSRPAMFAETVMCSTQLLYPEGIIDTAQDVTRKLVHTIASQWIGVNIIPEEPQDNWAIIGASHFMTDLFMKDLCGNNEYRFRMKTHSDRVCELDHERPSIYDMGTLLHLDPAEYDFLSIKAPLVLFILDRRMTKTTGVSKIPAVIAKIMTRARTEELKNNALSTDYFQKMIERFFHMKIDDFMNQWVKGAGCPRFSASQRFNKKKLVIEMNIRQTQGNLLTERELEIDSFMRDVREDFNSVYAAPQQNVFTGPMTIRIHEADGTPYEHIVEIKDANTTVEVPYNTKYKRLKRSKRQKNRSTKVITENVEEDNDSLVYCLGDTLQNEEEVIKWRLTEWTVEDEEKMSSESFEWIRLDTDFEWICNIRLAMPGYMFASQLQQDRDVAAQLESIQHIGNYQSSPLISTILLRTMIDSRYFHGIRSAAALALVKHATNEHDCDMIGFYHLKTAFEELFCVNENNSQMTRPNDFSDTLSYFLQCSIIEALSRIRDEKGYTPKQVKEFLLDKLKFNDNTLNDFSDAFYVSKLMKGLSDSLIYRPKKPTETYMDIDMETEFHDMKLLEQSCLDEIDRYRRMDEWTSSYQNLYSRTALECQSKLIRFGIIENLSSLHFLQYTRPGNYDLLRISAYDILTKMNIFENDSLLKYILHCMVADGSTYIRDCLRLSFGKALGRKAIGEINSDLPQSDGLVIEDVNADMRRNDMARRQTIDGAMDALRKELNENISLKKFLWNSVCHPEVGFEDIRALLEYCKLLYTPIDEAKVILKLPRYWKVQNLGKGQLRFSQINKTRSKILPKWQSKLNVVPINNAIRNPIKLTIKKPLKSQSPAPIIEQPPSTSQHVRRPSQISTGPTKGTVLKLKFKSS